MLGVSILAVAVALSQIFSGADAGSGDSRAGLSRPSLVSIFEAEPQLLTAPAQTIGKLRRLGVDTIRLFVNWAAIAPDPRSRIRPSFDAGDPAAYPAGNWAPFDAIVRDAAARGVRVDVDLSDPPPVWAAGPGAPNPAANPQWAPSPPEFGQFVRAVARRYDGAYKPPGASRALPRVRFWSVWNEPNYGPDLAPQTIDHSSIEVAPALYRRLLDAAWTALHATGHGRDTILIDELAPRGITIGDAPGTYGGMVPLRFLRALYCVDSSYRPLRGQAALARSCPSGAPGSAAFRNAHPALFRATGVAVHPYPQGQPPNVPAFDEPDYADLPALPTLENVLDRIQRAYGSTTRFDVYSTEYGYQTNPPQPFFRSTTPELAAYYLNWAEYISWRDPRIRSFDQYQLTDPAHGTFASGLQFASGAPKPSYGAYRIPLYLPVTSGSSGQSLEVWGCVRPARYARLETGMAQRVLIQFRARGASAFQTLRGVTLSDPYGYFDVLQSFPGSGSVRLAWAYPRGPTVFSRTVAITIR
jgi:hypothetical protein